MNIQGIKTQPDPYEPYLLSQAIKSGPFVFVSGQAGYDDDGNIVQGGFSAQGEQAFDNLNRAARDRRRRLDQALGDQDLTVEMSYMWSRPRYG